MKEYIDKSALVAEIDKHLSYYKDLKDRGILSKEGEAAYRAVRILKSDINSIEVKEMDLKKEIDEVIHNYKLNNHRHTSICAPDIEWLAKHFFELGFKNAKGGINMATIKSHTDIEQSKKLTEILSIKSADMYYWCGEDLRIGGYRAMDIDYDIPCWSLAAFFDVLPDGTDVTKDKSDTENEKYMCTVSIKDYLITTFANNPVDACVDAVIKLHKHNML